MRALIYTRVSEDRAEGRSVREQEEEARRVCEREGWEIAEVVTDSVGASRHSKGKRTGWDRACKLLEAGDVDVLVTWEASRAQRDLVAYGELRDLCASTKTLWSYSGRTHDLTQSHDRFTTGLDALLAEREADQIAERVQRAVRANALAGRPHGRRLYGYRRLYDPDTGRLLGQEPHPEEAPVVRRMFADYLAGYSPKSIADDLTERGIMTGTGIPWIDTQVFRALGNPAYAARRVHRGEIIGPAAWPALVDDVTFDRAQERLKSRSQVHASPTSRLLTGVARCGVCNGRITVNTDRKVRLVYICRRAACVGRDLAKLDTFVSGALVRRLEAAKSPSLAVSDSDEVAELHDQIAELEARLDAAVGQFTTGELSARMLARVEQSIVADLAGLRDRLRRLSVPQHLDLPAGDVGEWWETIGPERQREWVNAYVEVLMIHKTTRGQRTFDPSKVEIVWR